MKGLAWTGSTQVFRYALHFIFILVLVRLLSPRDFGLVGTAAIFSGFIGSLKGFGLIASLYQRQNLSQEEVSSVFWMNLGINIGLVAIVVLSAPSVAEFFHEAELERILYVSAVGIPLSSVWDIQMVLLRRKLDFRAIGIVGVLSEFAGGMSAIILAAQGFGVLSLVLRELIASVASMIVFWTFFGNWLPSRHFRFDDLRSMWGYGLSRTGSVFTDFAKNQADYFFIGKLLGAEALGFYMIAFNLVKYPVTRILPVLNMVLFPAMVSIQDDITKVKGVHLRVMKVLVLVGMPALLGLALFSEEIVTILYGNKWLPSIPVLEILAIWGFLYLLTSQLSILQLALGRADLDFRLTLVGLALLVPSFYFAAGIGIVAVAWAWLLPSIVIFEFYRRSSHGLIHLRFAEFAAALRRPFAVSGLALSVMLVLKVTLHLVWPSLGDGVLVLVCTLFAAAGGVVAYLKIEEAQDIEVMKQYVRSVLAR